MTDLMFGDETYAVIGAAIEVHRELGPGFLEKVYQEAMQLELSARKIPFEAEMQIDVSYKGNLLAQRYSADLVCFGKIVVELKSIKKLSKVEEAQIPNCLRATGSLVGLLFNFGSHGKLEYRSFVV